MHHLVCFFQSGDSIILEDIVSESEVQKVILNIKDTQPFWHKNCLVKNVVKYEIYFSDDSCQKTLAKLQNELTSGTICIPYGDDVELITTDNKYFGNVTKLF